MLTPNRNMIAAPPFYTVRQVEGRWLLEAPPLNPHQTPYRRPLEDPAD